VSEERPNIVGRLGQLIYWFALAAAVLSALFVLIAVFFGTSGERAGAALFFGVISFGFWLAGRAARYLLKGD
jgi:hypothetical protein